MKLVEMICKELGVEVEEIWQGSDGKFYSIEVDGRLANYGQKVEDEEPYTDWIERVLSGNLKPKWKPREGELYHYADISSPYLHKCNVWGSSDSDYWRLEHNLIYKTAEEAEDAADRILKSLKEYR